jgi:uncharacterized protein (DUF4415 family)
MSKQPNPDATDPDNPEWTDQEARQASRLPDLPEPLRSKLRGRPQAAVIKERIGIRLSPDVVQAFRATGAGWQTRVDAALRDWLKSHPSA